MRRSLVDTIGSDVQSVGRPKLVTRHCMVTVRLGRLRPGAWHRRRSSALGGITVSPAASAVCGAAAT